MVATPYSVLSQPPAAVAAGHATLTLLQVWMVAQVVVAVCLTLGKVRMEVTVLRDKAITEAGVAVVVALAAAVVVLVASAVRLRHPVMAELAYYPQFQEVQYIMAVVAAAGHGALAVLLAV
jgi:hypothetical protein